jgi:hypothetical protein
MRHITFLRNPTLPEVCVAPDVKRVNIDPAIAEVKRPHFRPA